MLPSLRLRVVPLVGKFELECGGQSQVRWLGELQADVNRHPSCVGTREAEKAQPIPADEIEWMVPIMDMLNRKACWC